MTKKDFFLLSLFTLNILWANAFKTFNVIPNYINWMSISTNENLFGVEDNDRIVKINTFPNPTNGNEIINLSIKAPKNVSGKITFMNFYGMVIGNIKVNESTKLRNPNGLVFYRYEDDLGNRVNGKIISTNSVLEVNTTLNVDSKAASKGFIKDETCYVEFADLLDGDIISFGTDDLIETNAFDTDGIAYVKMFVDGVFHSRVTSPPYSFSVRDLSLGSHTLKLWMKDGNSDPTWTGSETITVVVETPVEGAPVCVITRPINLDILDAGDVRVDVTATDDVRIENVQFLINDYLVDTDDTRPFSSVLENLQGGTYIITAIATDNEGNTTRDSVKITVTPNQISGQYNFVRLNGHKPIMDKQMFMDVGANRNIDDDREFEWDNINGPSVIRIPDWVTERPDDSAVYYMYFSHHHGQAIRMAWSANIEGPWHLYNMEPEVPNNEKGVLRFDNGGSIREADQIIELDNGLTIIEHMASPDIIIDDVNESIIMYFHARYEFEGEYIGQVTFVATSPDGLDFNNNTIAPVIQARPYFDVWEYNGDYYGFSTNSNIARHPDPDDNFFEPVGPFNYADEYFVDGHKILNSDIINDNGDRAVLRHVKALVKDDTVYATFSCMHDTPEQLYYRTIDLTASDDWTRWEASPSKRLATAEAGWEGGQFPVVASDPGARDKGVNQLRDPEIFEDADGQIYIFYTGQGEDAIGVARLEWVD